MEIGFNDDVDYNGVTFHIQTEDHGLKDPRVSTQLFTGGRVLDNQIVNYGHLIEDLTEESERKSKIRKVMVAAHRNIYKKLVSGDYDEPMDFALDKTAELDRIGAVKVAEKFEPSQSRVPEAAQVVEEDGKVTFTFETGDQIDLSMLRQQLNQIDLFPPDDASGGALFDELTEEINDELAMEIQIDVEHDEPMGRPTLISQAVVIMPSFKPTGRRAFQGLLEPPPEVDIVDMVLQYLETQGA